MGRAATPGSATRQQHDRLLDAAKAADVGPAVLIGLARRERNKRRTMSRVRMPGLRDLSDLSMFEISGLIDLIETAAETGDRSKLGVCLRCVRIGLDGALPCMHDGAGSSDTLRRVAEHDRWTGAAR